MVARVVKLRKRSATFTFVLRITAKNAICWPNKVYLDLWPDLENLGNRNVILQLTDSCRRGYGYLLQGVSGYVVYSRVV